MSNEIFNHPRLRELFPEFLVRVHWLIRFSSPLMVAAMTECERRADCDAVAAAMIPYLEEHIAEEEGHDELLLQDLESIGMSREEVLRRLPDPCVAGAQGAMHYWTVHHYPVAMFGSLVPSECYQTSLAAIDFMHQRSGYPRSAFRTIELHSELDKEHGAEALRFLDSLPLTEWHHEVLGVAALNFLVGTTQMYSERLRKKIDLMLPELAAVSGDLVTHPEFRSLFPIMLEHMHWMIRCSVPLMRTTLQRSRELAATDELAAALAPYLEQHIKEELGHDEWLLEDLELLGVPRAKVLAQIPSPVAAACVGARYYWILHHHPIAELGAIAVMEGYPTSIEAIDYMEEVTGYPRLAFRTLEKHAHIDIRHRDELLSVIDNLPLTEEHHHILSVVALYTIESASAVYREVLEHATEFLAAETTSRWTNLCRTV